MMNDWTASQIKEVVAGEINAERRLRDALRTEDRQRFEEYKLQVAKALKLQATEYERRLEDLNHAHAEAQRVLGTYIPRDSYIKDQDAFRDLKGRVDIEFADRTGRSKALPYVLSIASVVISVLVAISVFMRQH